MMSSKITGSADVAGSVVGAIKFIDTSVSRMNMREGPLGKGGDYQCDPPVRQRKIRCITVGDSL